MIRACSVFPFCVKIGDNDGCVLFSVVLDQAQVFSLGFYIFERAMRDSFSCFLQDSSSGKSLATAPPVISQNTQMREDASFEAGNRFCEEVFRS